MNNIVYLLNFQVHFQRVSPEFVALLTKIGLKILSFTITAKCWAVERADSPPLPPPHQEVIDAV